MKKTLIATALALVSLSSFAADYFVVVPLPGKATQLAGIDVALTSSALPQAMVGQAFSHNFTANLRVTGDSAFSGSGVSWRVVSGTLPAGLTLNASTGELSGTPTAAGTADITVKATYKTKSGQQAYQVVAKQLTVALAQSSIPAAKVNTAYVAYDFKQHLTVTGDPAYKAELAAFTATGLPEGLALSSAGVLTGTPKTKNTAGTNFTISAAYKNASGQQVYNLVVNGVALQVKQINAGYYHSCAVTTAGAAVCWGSNWSGQLGNGTKTDSNTPVAVTGLSSGVASIYAGQTYTCALTTAGGVKCWGDRYQVGDGGAADRTTPVDIAGLTSGVKSLSARYVHTCAVTSAGGVKCWGDNYKGQMGFASPSYTMAPADVPGLSGVTTVAAGDYHTCALTTSGGAMCWGGNNNGELGNGSTTKSVTPVAVVGLTGATSLSAGGYHNCAIVAGGRACWGSNAYGQLGDGTTTTRNSLVTVLDGTKVVSAGEDHSCLVTSAGAARCFGRGGDGELGYGTNSNSAATNINIPSLASGVQSISAGSYISCAILSTGDAKCWGSNPNGELGDGTNDNKNTPVDVAPVN